MQIDFVERDIKNMQINKRDEILEKSIIHTRLCMIKELLKTKFLSTEFIIKDNDDFQSIWVDKNNISIYDVFYGFKIVINSNKIIFFEDKEQHKEEHNSTIGEYYDSTHVTMLEYIENFIIKNRKDKYNYILRQKKLKRIMR